MSRDNDVVYMEKIGDGVAVIRLNQLRKKNAISAHMMDLLSGFLDEADIDDEINVVVLRGEGDVFSSGGDLSQSTPEESTPEHARKTYRRYCAAINAIRFCSKPVIAMVDGYAVGGGFALALASDLICISSEAKIIPAFCQIGIAPEMAIVKMLPELVGEQRAKEIIFLGDTLDGNRLGELGIANRVCSSDSLELETYALARSLAKMPSASIQVAKAMINSLSDGKLSSSLSMEQTASPFCITTEAHGALQGSS